MSAKKSPLALVKEKFGEKSKLVDKLVGLLDTDDEGKDGLKERLLAASNKKLLRLFSVSEKVRQEYGSLDKLAEHVAKLLGRAKDSDYVRRLSQYSPANLLDRAQALAKRAGEKRAASKAEKAEKAEKPADKPKAKAAAKEKAAPKKKAPATKATKPKAEKPKAKAKPKK